jgi:hypothetical protein
MVLTAMTLLVAVPASGFAQTPSGDKMKDEKMEHDKMKHDKMKMEQGDKMKGQMKDDKMKGQMKDDKMMGDKMMKGTKSGDTMGKEDDKMEKK